MGRIAILNGDILTWPGGLQRGGVLIESGVIVAVGPQVAEAIPPDAQVINAADKIIAPGYIDIHVHGGAGYDTMDATPEALSAMAAFFAAHGVTSFLPTTVTASREDTLAAIRAVAEFQRQPPQGAQALGIHLEGPYINTSYRGAQNPQFAHSPEPEEYRAFFAAGNVKLISLAPEHPASADLISYAVAQGATVAVGHSAATYEQVLAAVSLGLTQATHTYNAMVGLHHREPGAVGAALTCDRIYAQIIVDLVHVHPAAVKLLLRAKGPERTILITDAIRAAGMPDEIYELGGQQIIVTKGEARLPAGNLAGSTLTMDRAVRSVMQATGCSLVDAIRMATLTPAESIGLADRKGRLAPGWDADIILLDKDLNVALTMVQGQIVPARGWLQ